MVCVEESRVSLVTKTPLIKKGLRLVSYSSGAVPEEGPRVTKTPLIKKGLRRLGLFVSVFFVVYVTKTPLIKKGLRHSFPFRISFELFPELQKHP